MEEWECALIRNTIWFNKKINWNRRVNNDEKLKTHKRLLMGFVLREHLMLSENLFLNYANKQICSKYWKVWIYKVSIKYNCLVIDVEELQKFISHSMWFYSHQSIKNKYFGYDM